VRYPKLRELKEAIKALFKGPYTSKFPYQPHKPYERFRGMPKFDEEYCVGCTACAQVCPAKAIDFQDSKNNGVPKRTLTLRLDLCIFCGQCQVNCLSEKGISLSQEYDLATTGSRQELEQAIEKELMLCDFCGEVIACQDHIIWVARRLGPLSFSNASLMLAYLGNIGLALKEKNSPKETSEFLRSDRIKILCSRCRREAVIKS
jgi:hydrogenase-4 component H